jgi:serine protease Do
MKKLILPALAMFLAFSAGAAFSLIISNYRKDGAMERLEAALKKVDASSSVFIAASNVAKRSVVGITVVTPDSTSAPVDYRDEQMSVPQFRFRNRSYASGLVIDGGGHIVTNQHVINVLGGRITVHLEDGREFEARVVGADQASDIAVLKVDAENLPVATLGNSDDIEVGELVLAIGNPFGLSHSVSLGLVSAKGRRNVGAALFEDYIQTDAAINPGNSGGPVVNLKGEVIGISTAIASVSRGYQGVAFAIPINMVKKIKDALIEKGRVERGWIGVYMQDVAGNLSRSFGLEGNAGVLVIGVQEESPAAEAGIQQEDILLAFDGTEVKDIAQLRTLVGQTQIGKSVPMKVMRKGEVLNFTVRVDDYENSMRTSKRAIAGSGFGIKVADATAEDAARLGANGEKGVVITEVAKGSPGGRAGLAPGMIIQKIGDYDVSTLDDFNKLSEYLEKALTLRLRVIKLGGTEYVVVSK